MNFRLIPCLLLDEGRLVKTSNFRQPKYVGDPINAIHVFNEKEVDELVVLDISARTKGRGIHWSLIQQVAGECFMPLAYGGGITSVSEIEKILKMGVEKIILNHEAHRSPDLIRNSVHIFGSSTVVVAVDVRKSFFGRYQCYDYLNQSSGGSLVERIRRVEEMGAGEIMLTSVDREGTSRGLDLELIRLVTSAVSIPVIAHGGAKDLEDCRNAITNGGAQAVAAGSLFVFHGKHKAVLITYPDRSAFGW